MNTQTKNAMHLQALAQFLSISPDDISELYYDHYGLPHFSADGGEYTVGTDQEADEAAAESIRSSLWAFKASFILCECGLPLELEEAIQSMQEQQCESCNDAIEALVEKCCKNGVTEFTESAISADGRGRFLSSYDGEENEETVEGTAFYIYRTN